MTFAPAAAKRSIQGVSVTSPASLDSYFREAVANERELIYSVDAAARLLRNTIAELRQHRANKGQHIEDVTDTNYLLLADVLTQVELLNSESR